MSSETDVSVRGVVWAGGIIMFLAAGHLLITGVISAQHLPDWFSGALWLGADGLDGLRDPAPAAGAFWMVWGSFAVPLGLVGALVVRFGRLGQVPPPYIAIGVAVWGLVAAVVLEPTPFVLVVIPAGMLLAAQRGRRAATA
ncbi:MULTISPECIES: hypothetical protein [unclassified Nonomuraea]|uniref:hypothetical protein n=1 Tax=unclassified Nonomuraea TaxID=2593643 RepID=UPI00340F3835